MAVWNYCTLSPSALVHFAFDLYDRDESGWIEHHEIEQMLQDMYGKKVKHSSQSLTRVRDHLETAVRQGAKEEAAAAKRREEGEQGDTALAAGEAAAAELAASKKKGGLNVHAAAGVAAATKVKQTNIHLTCTTAVTARVVYTSITVSLVLVLAMLSLVTIPRYSIEY